MKNANKITIAALFAVAIFTQPLALVKAKTLEVSPPAKTSTMFFADRYVTAYYLVDPKNFKTIVTIAPGIEGKGNPMQFVNTLNDGEKAEYSVGGYGNNAIKVKLSLVRKGDKIKADIKTQTPQHIS